MGGCVSDNRTSRQTPPIPLSPKISTVSVPVPPSDPNLNQNLITGMVKIKVILIDGSIYELVTKKKNTVSKIKRDLC